MKTQSIALTIFSGLIAFGLLLFFIQILTRKLRGISESETGLKLSFTVHIGGMLISCGLLFAKAIPLIPEAFEIQWAMYKESYVLEALQLVAAIIGFCFLWLGIIYFIVNAMAAIILGKRDEVIEMERDNVSYFLSRALVLMTLAMIGASVLESFLRLFMPVLDVPFYH